MIPERTNGHAPSFRPHPLLSGPHQQTIAGLFLPTRTPRLTSECVALALPDGDRLAVHVTQPKVNSTETIVVLVHGLAGCHASSYISRTATKLVANGFVAIRVDLRGCGAGWNWARRAFHAGRTSDLRHVIEYIVEQYPQMAIALVGFSLGGHLVLKYLSEVCDQTPNQLRAALVVGPPLDLARCSDLVRVSLSGIYDRYFAHKLWCHYRQRMKAGMLPNLQVNKPRSLLEFDDQITAPLAGFESAENYYSTVSSYQCLSTIRVPTDVITSADDPMIPFEMVQSAPRPECLRLHVLPNGGHLGFIGDRRYSAGGSCPPSLVADRRWLDWRVVAWAQAPTAFSCGAR